MRPERIKKLRPNRVTELVNPVDTLHLVSPDMAPHVWPRIEKYIADANSYMGGKFAAHDHLGRVLAGVADLWVGTGERAACIGEPILYPHTAVYCVMLLGGEGGHDWKRYDRVFQEMARRRECPAIEIVGRPGWRPTLKALNYDLVHYVWRKEL